MRPAADGVPSDSEVLYWLRAKKEDGIEADRIRDLVRSWGSWGEALERGDDVSVADQLIERAVQGRLLVPLRRSEYIHEQSETNRWFQFGSVALLAGRVAYLREVHDLERSGPVRPGRLRME